MTLSSLACGVLLGSISDPRIRHGPWEFQGGNGRPKPVSHPGRSSDPF